MPLKRDTVKMNIIKELRIERNRSQSDIAKICGVHQTAVSQWETGRTSPDTKSLLCLSEYFGVSVDRLIGGDDGTQMVKVLGYVRAGIPIEAVENVLDYEEISSDMAKKGEYFGLRVCGDSMSPRICEGDVVIVRCQQDVESGDTAVVMVNGTDATVKRVIKNGTSIMLVPLNPEYEPIVFSRAEVKSLPVTIVGKVVELRGKF